MSNRKVGIITTYQSFRSNYGAVLQAFALSRQLDILGYDAQIMPYISESEVCRIASQQPKESFIGKWLRRARHIFNFKRVKNYFMLRKQETLMKAFDKFNQAHLPLYREKTIGVQDLTSIAADFYAFISGSDQVWSTKLQGNCCDKGMFLKFVPENVKRIAYAPSMGSRCSGNEVENDIRNSVSNYNAVSLREQDGADYLYEIMGNRYPVVLDPTLLLPPSEYECLVKKPDGIPDKYILVYRFGRMEHTLACISELAKALNLPVIELPSSFVSLEDRLKKRYDIGPDKFLWLIRHASLVCTDSYHATIFSIISHTPFLTFFRIEPSRADTNMNARVLELLGMTGLSGRLVYPGQTPDMDEVFKVDFDTADKRIAEKRTDSLAYLENVLNNSKEV